MSFTKNNFAAPSSDGVHTLSGTVYLPDGEIKGYFQIAHGMTEHIERYDRFMSELAEEGFLCFGHDHVGHGHTAKCDGELGFIAHENGYDVLARDIKSFSDAVFSEYGKAVGTPYYLMGHSMGSFIVRYAASKYVKPDKLIVMGTAGANPAADAGLLLIGIIKKIKGETHFSPLIDRIAFGGYNKRFGGGTGGDPKPWLTNDVEIRKKYYADKYCNFNFSVSAMGDLIRLIKYANSAECYGNLQKDMPILLVAGEDDPVGNYGKGIRDVNERLKNAGCRSQMILYGGARHEILNDFCYDRVKRDILEFCK